MRGCFGYPSQQHTVVVDGGGGARLWRPGRRRRAKSCSLSLWRVSPAHLARGHLARHHRRCWLAVAVTLLQDFQTQPCREFQPHLANQCKVRLIPVSPDQTWFILHDKMHARLNVSQFTAVKNDSCIACTARIIQLYCCTRTVCASQINIESCAAEDPADTYISTF